MNIKSQSLQLVMAVLHMWWECSVYGLAEKHLAYQICKTGYCSHSELVRWGAAGNRCLLQSEFTLTTPCCLPSQSRRKAFNLCLHRGSDSGCSRYALLCYPNMDVLILKISALLELMFWEWELLHHDYWLINHSVIVTILHWKGRYWHTAGIPTDLHHADLQHCYFSHVFTKLFQ